MSFQFGASVMPVRPLLFDSSPESFDPLILVQELNHRVANEYAAAIACLSLEAAETASSEGRAVLEQVRTRLHAFAAVHRTLLPPSCPKAMELGGYLERVCGALAKATLAERRLSLNLPDYGVAIDPLRAWRFGLIIAELLTNAARHGDADAEIVVEMGVADGEVVCSVFNDGAFGAGLQRGFGLRVVEGLTCELEGRIEAHFGTNGAFVLVAAPFRGDAVTDSKARDSRPRRITDLPAAESTG